MHTDEYAPTWSILVRLLCSFTKYLSSKIHIFLVYVRKKLCLNKVNQAVYKFMDVLRKEDRWSQASHFFCIFTYT